MIPKTDLVVLERINLRDRRVAMAAKDLQMALNVIGVVRWTCAVSNVQLVEQWNRDKNQVTDKMLDEHDMLSTPKSSWKHANDAARHVLFYTLKEKRKT